MLEIVHITIKKVFFIGCIRLESVLHCSYVLGLNDVCCCFYFSDLHD